eukprot:4643988-Prorocentrum_lima.AAC.1
MVAKKLGIFATRAGMDVSKLQILMNSTATSHDHKCKASPLIVTPTKDAPDVKKRSDPHPQTP